MRAYHEKETDNFTAGTGFAGSRSTKPVKWRLRIPILPHERTKKNSPTSILPSPWRVSAARLVHAAHRRRIQAPAGMVGQHHAQKSRPPQWRKEVKRGKWNIFVKTFGKHPFIWAENIIFALRIMTWQKSLMYYCSTHSKKNKRTFGVPAEWTNAGSYFFFLLCHLFPEYLRFPILSNTRNCLSASPGVFSYIRE